MTHRRSSQRVIVIFLLLAAAGSAHADQLVYVALPQPCRVVDTRSSNGGAGPLTAAHGAYLFGTTTADISSTAQNGSSTGCGIVSGVAAVSVSLNMLDASASGNIATWNPDSGTTAPNIGTGVYNPSVVNPTAGQVLYNTGYTTIPVGSASGGNAGKFYLKVANGQIDMTINVVGYWRQVSWGETISGSNGVALGYQTTSSGGFATALGQNTTASGSASTAMGYQTQATQPASFAAGQGNTASGYASVAMGFGSVASGYTSVAMGYQTQASGSQSTALGYQTWARDTATTALGYQTSASGVGSLASGQGAISVGASSVALGQNVQAIGNYSVALGSYSRPNTDGSFVYCDATCTSGLDIVLNNPNEFIVLASGGVNFITSAASTDPRTGVFLNPGSGSWGSASDRNGKTAVLPVNPRDVLARVVALPMNTWQYKTQEAKYRHMGPMAQDFYAAFHLGERDTGIDTIDSEGVALAALQGLNAKLEEKVAEKDREIAALQAEVAKQNARIASIETDARKIVQIEAELLAMQRNSASVATVAQKP